MNGVAYLPSISSPCECANCTMRALLWNRALLLDPRYGIGGA